MESRSSATVPFQLSSEANLSESVVKKLTHQAGLGSAFRIVFEVSDGGIVIPFLTSRSLAPATGTSTVKTKVSKPAAFARSTSAIERSRSFHIYSWNQLRPSGAILATSSIERVPMVESV